MARRRFFVDEIRGGHARLEGDEAHHLTRVLRVESGQRYEISDNERVYLAEIEAARKDLVSFAIVEELARRQAAVRASLYASLIRFERFELLIEKATELGVERVVPVIAERSERGLDRAAEKRLSRWERIAREASEQSRRDRLPKIEPVIRIQQAIEEAGGMRFLLDEEGGAEPLFDALPEHRSPADEVALLVGPEGGWSERERTAIVAKGWRPMSLGSAILKTETAAIAAIAIIIAAWGSRS